MRLSKCFSLCYNFFWTTNLLKKLILITNTIVKMVFNFIKDFVNASDKLFSTSENLPDAISEMMQNLSKQIDELKDLKEGLRR